MTVFVLFVFIIQESLESVLLVLIARVALDLDGTCSYQEPGAITEWASCQMSKLWVAHAPGMSGTLPHHRLQRKPLVSDPGMNHGTCVTHVPWCMSRSLTRGGEENVPGIPGACATRKFTYLARRPCSQLWVQPTKAAWTTRTWSVILWLFGPQTHKQTLHCLHTGIEAAGDMNTKETPKTRQYITLHYFIS